MNKSKEFLKIQNIEIYNYYRERLINLALSQFQWSGEIFTGANATCDRLWFEKSLLFNGKASLLIPKGCDYWLSLDYMWNNAIINVYGYPTSIIGIGANAKQIETDTFMILFDNMLCAPLAPKVNLFARLLWEVHNTFRSNLGKQRTPYLVYGSRNASLTNRNIMNEVENFEEVIFLSDKADQNAIQSLNLNVNYIGNDLLDSLKTIWAMALSELGITADNTKRERMLNNELTMDRQEDVISLNSRLMNRIDFCNKWNAKYADKYGEISVNLSSVDTEFRIFGENTFTDTQDTMTQHASKEG